MTQRFELATVLGPSGMIRATAGIAGTTASKTESVGALIGLVALGVLLFTTGMLAVRRVHRAGRAPLSGSIPFGPTEVVRRLTPRPWLRPPNA